MQSCSPFTAAIDSDPGNRARISCSVIQTASMPPPAQQDSINLPRFETVATASGSENTPDRVAATYSPRLCPIIASGRAPQCIQSRASAYSTVNKAACARSVCASRRLAASCCPSSGNR